MRHITDIGERGCRKRRSDRPKPRRSAEAVAVTEICFIGLSHAASVKAAYCRLYGEPNKGNLSGQHVERTTLRSRLTIHPPLDAKAGVKAAA